MTERRSAKMLHNPFYISIIRLIKTGETFSGGHKPLISKLLFDRVQERFLAKNRPKKRKNDFLFKKMLRCKKCHSILTGERQKGIIYYRCHTKGCPTLCIREDRVEQEFQRIFKTISFSPQEQTWFINKLKSFNVNWGREYQDRLNAMTLDLKQIMERLHRLTDAFLDGAVDRELFEERKAMLLLKRKELEDRIEIYKKKKERFPAQLHNFFELIKSALTVYERGTQMEKRELVEKVISNRWILGKSPMFTVKYPYSEFVNRAAVSCSGP